MDTNIIDRINCLKQEKIELGSYNKLALKYGVNVRYIWDLLANGKIPKSSKVRKKLGIMKQGLSYTITRRQKLNEIANKMGYASWCAYESAMIRESECQNIIQS